MDEILFLSHRIPYPPNKGDKIRSFHLLKHLAARFKVHVGTFVDDPEDWQYLPQLKAFCAETCVLPLSRRASTLRGLTGFLNGSPLTLPYYRHATLQRWVDDRIATGKIRCGVVFSSSMAQYLEKHGGLRRIADLVDVDSDKWAQYAARASFPKRWVFAREGRTLLDYERQVAESFDATFLVSRAEAALLRKLVPSAAERIQHFNNGVDTEYFSPETAHDSPFSPDEKAIVFTGAMDYWPNVDAVTWFADEVLPGLRQRCPEAVFVIVGTRPSPAVLELKKRPGVRVTGSVPDVRPYLAHASLVVAPLRVARGIQNKVLEAMAMAQAVLTSPAALEGIEAEPGKDLLLAESAADAIDAAAAYLASPDRSIGSNARARVLSSYGWAPSLAPVLDAISGAAPALA